MNKTSLVLDRFFLFFLYLTFDLLFFIPFLLVLALLSLATVIAVVFFLLGGSFISSSLGVSYEFFWGTFLGSFTQVFNLFDYFFYSYDYLVVGFLLIFLSLFLVGFFLFSFFSFLSFLKKYLAIRYQPIFRKEQV